MISKSNTILALEWDRNEVRYAVVGTAGRRMIVRDLGRLATVGEEGQGAAEAMLADVKGLVRVRKPQVVVTLNRSTVEEAETSLPAATEHEISQLIVNQAYERWPGIAPLGVVDYYSLEEGPDGLKRYSLTVLDSERKQELEDQFKELGWRISSLQLRHLAVANLLRRSVDLAAHPQSVLLSLGRSEAELIVFSSEQLALVRTIPLPVDSEPDPLANQLILEIQRSLAVTANPVVSGQEAGASIFLFGSRFEQQGLAECLERELQRPVTILNPLEQFPRSIKDVPDRIHQFAALLGSVLDQPRTLTVDFQRPKCVRSVPPIYQRLAVYGSAAAVLLGILIWSGLGQVATARSNSQKLKQELSSYEKKLEALTEKTRVVKDVQDWHGDDINWLEELRSFSARFPERSDAQVKSMSMTLGTNNRGIISMNLRAKNDLVISRLEQAIRDGFHQIRTNQLSQNADDQEFPWQFVAQVILTRRDRDEYRSELPSSNAGDSKTPPIGSEQREAPTTSSGETP